MAYRPTKVALQELREIALSQGGYFTAKQAAKVGYDYPHLDYHKRAGNFERVGNGFYRLREVPLADQDDLIRLAFWSRDRNDQPQAVASYQTALAIHELTDLLPKKIHLTVPKTFRKKTPPGVVLHRDRPIKLETEQRQGFQVTTPLRSLFDIAADEGISEEHLQQAVNQAVNRGLVRKSTLEEHAAKLPPNNRLSRALALMR